MFNNTVRGLDKLFHNDIKAPKIILVSGSPGSMKSSFTYELLTKYVEKTGEFGLFATLEETTESHLNNMESIGIAPHTNLQVTDYTDFRGEDEEQVDYLMFTENMLKYFKEKHGNKFTTFAFDSLGALYSLMPNNGNDMRRRMYLFFKMLRELKLISFIIIERSIEGESHLLGNEGFLSDGILVMGLKRKQGKIVRYVQIEKMRATSHSMEAHAIEVGESGIQVLGPIFD